MPPAARTSRGARQYRLCGVGVFDAVFRDGTRFEGRWLQLVAAPARSRPGRTGYVIGKKALANAVDRNRIRRVLRVVVARARPTADSFDVILRLKRGCARHEAPLVAQEAQRLIEVLLERAGAMTL